MTYLLYVVKENPHGLLSPSTTGSHLGQVWQWRLHLTSSSYTALTSLLNSKFHLETKEALPAASQAVSLMECLAICVSIYGTAILSDQVHGGGVGKFPLGSIKHYAKRANCSSGITVRISLRSRDQLQAEGLTIVNGLRKKGRPIMVISPVCLTTRRRTRCVGIGQSKTAPWLVTRSCI